LPDQRTFVADLLGNCEGFRMLALLCWPDRMERLAMVGISQLSMLEAEPVIRFLKAALSTVEKGLPPRGTCSRLINECTADSSIRMSLHDLTIGVVVRYSNFVCWEVGDYPELKFWKCLATPEVQNKIRLIRLSMIDEITEKLITPYGGLEGVASKGEGLGSLDNDPEARLFGYPMLAGLILYLIGVLHCQFGKKKASVNLAAGIIEAVVSLGKTSTVFRHLKGEEVWTKFRWLAPAWAGVLAEANGQRIDWLTEKDALESRVFDVITNPERRERAFRFASWFSRFASTERANQSAKDKTYIPAHEVIAFPDAVAAKKPDLPTLPNWIFTEVARWKKRGKSKGSK